MKDVTLNDLSSLPLDLFQIFTAIEFALISPVLILLLMGLGELLFQIYAQSLLTGEVQKAGRDAGIEGGAAITGDLDAKVVTQLSPLIKNLSNNCTTSVTTASWCSTRKSYDNFSKIAPEPFTDTNGDGIRQAGECFTDENGNGTWDSDPGLSGQGGASATVIYTMTVRFPHFFPVAGLLGWTGLQTISATTLLKNQPYATQTTFDDKTICT